MLPDIPSHLITVKFILGLPPYPENPVSKEAMERSTTLKQIRAEMDEFGDIVLLDVSAVGCVQAEGVLTGRLSTISTWARRMSTSSMSRMHMLAKGGSKVGHVS